MSNFVNFVSASADSSDKEAAIEQASRCLDQFTDAFNACDTQAMDLQLAFPHLMLSGANRIQWDQAGQHPQGFFDMLKAQGWRKTEYVSKTPVLASDHKVHFVVRYTRQDASGQVLSLHENLWIVVLDAGQWKIALRSY